MSPRNRRHRSLRSVLERLVCRPPPRVQDRALDAVDADAVTGASPARSDTVDVACWTPVGTAPADDESREPRAMLFAEPPSPSEIVVHTLVLEVDAPTRSLGVNYRSLDVRVLPTRGVQVRTDDDESVPVVEAHADDGTFRVTVADTQADGALFVEYAATRSPPGGRHTVDVVVDDEHHTEVQLFVVG